MIPVKDNARILFIGDSITDVKFNKRQNRKIGGKQVYCLQVAKELGKTHTGLTFFYRGIASNRSYHVYDRLTKDCMELKPDIVVLLIGVNDAWEHYVPEQYPPLLRPMEPHMQEIYRRLAMELPEAKVIAMLPFLIDSVEEKRPFHKILNEYRESLREYAKERADAIIDLQKMFDEVQTKEKPCDLARDGIHPTNLGHCYIAKELLRVLGM